MLTCSNCGASVREGARFCTTCGTRLNDPVATDATSVWATPESSAPAATASEPVAATSTWSGPTSERNDDSPELEATSDPAARPVADEDVADTGTPSTTASRSEEGFTWSWGTSASKDSAEPAPATDQVDEESGIVLEESEAQESDTDSDELVDATEIDILEVEETGSDSDEEAGSDPETSDTMLVVEDDQDANADDGESETLAAWAEQWETPEPEGDTPSNDELPEPVPVPPTAIDQAPDTAVTAGNTRASSDDEEDTVARADRLIGELRSMIPSLLRPMPAVPAVSADTSAIAEELAGAARAGQFDDIRETLLAAREHPRDVDTMLTLSGKINRLLELLDDRDNLAQTAESAATRLRPDGDPSDL